MTDNHNTTGALWDWLGRYDAAEEEPATLVTRLAELLNATGIAINRVSCWLPTSHPELWGTQVIWSQTEGAHSIRRDHEVYDTDTFQNTPAQAVFESGTAMRWSLEVQAEDLPYDLLREVQATGATDYYIVPFALNNGSAWIAFTTPASGGFDDNHLALLEQVCHRFEWKIRVVVSETSTRSLLQIYLGPNAAQRVGNGEFKRGTGTTLNAVLWFCDLRDYTSLGDEVVPAEVVRTLDHYFECVAGPIEDQGGEILKFIGDAVLAVFPCSDDPVDAARSALKAAIKAKDQLDALNQIQREKDERELRMGIALHSGEVFYGNIGGRSRLDFTVIGAAVNEVCRIEALCKPLGIPLLISEQIATTLADEVALRFIGAHELRGVSAPSRIFTLPRFATKDE